MDDHAPKDSVEKATHVTIYTDGAAEPNPGPGGYGVVLLHGKHRKELSGGFRLTTNNRMELLAVIVGLESLKKSCHVTVYSDSKYVVDSVQRGSVQKWKAKNWYRTSSEKAKNADLWERFLHAFEKHKVRFRWVKGHAGIAENERCDELAVAGAQSGTSHADVGYMAEIGNSKPELAESETARQSKPGHAIHSKIAGGEAITHRAEGEPCRKCGTPIVRRETKPKPHKPGQNYFYEWYLWCPGCHTMYLVDDAKRPIRRKS